MRRLRVSYTLTPEHRKFSRNAEVERIRYMKFGKALEKAIIEKFGEDAVEIELMLDQGATGNFEVPIPRPLRGPPWSSARCL